jgi:hypothetical protein
VAFCFYVSVRSFVIHSDILIESDGIGVRGGVVVVREGWYKASRLHTF